MILHLPNNGALKQTLSEYITLCNALDSISEHLDKEPWQVAAMHADLYDCYDQLKYILFRLEEHKLKVDRVKS